MGKEVIVATTLARDPRSKALVETSKTKANEYLNKRAQIVDARKAKEQEINKVAERLDKLEDQLGLILEMLQKLERK